MRSPYLSFIFLLVIGIIGGSIALEQMLWNECRATPHSWLYCVRVLGSR